MNLFSQIDSPADTTSDPFALAGKPTMSGKIHCFEAAGLGKAPFTYLGEKFQEIQYEERVLGHIGGCTLTTKPGGTCDYCGTAIVNMFLIESADGHRFKVGCECVKKTGDKGLIHKVERAVKKMKKERELAKKKAQAEADRKLCETFQIGKLASFPHPHPYRAAQGETLYDWCKWMKEVKNYKTLAAMIRRYL